MEIKTRDQTAPRWRLHHASLLQRDVSVSSEDQVIDDVDAERLPRLHKFPREEEVVAGRRRVTRGVVVKDDDARCVVIEGEAEDVPRGDRRGVQCPNIDLTLPDDAVLRIEVDRAQALLNVVAVADDERS